MGQIEVKEGMEEGEGMNLVVDDRPEEGTPFPLKQLPLFVTVAQIRDKFLFDVTLEEECCADAMLCVIVDAKCGNIVGLHKLRGLFDISTLPEMLKRCKATAAALIQQLERELVIKDVGV